MSAHADRRDARIAQLQRAGNKRALHVGHLEDKNAALRYEIRSLEQTLVRCHFAESVDDVRAIVIERIPRRMKRLRNRGAA